MRTGNVIGDDVAGVQLDVAAFLLEIGHAVGLEVDFYVRVFIGLGARQRVRDAMLAHLDLAQLQARDGGVIDAAFERGRLQRVDIEVPAQARQSIDPALDLPLRRQSGRRERMNCVGH